MEEVQFFPNAIIAERVYGENGVKLRWIGNIVEDIDPRVLCWNDSEARGPVNRLRAGD
jgi:hypothetical protein